MTLVSAYRRTISIRLTYFSSLRNSNALLDSNLHSTSLRSFATFVSGYDFCPHCKVEILPIKKSSGNLSSAEIHKRRLLEFDRESAKRTVIFDDQADYFSNTNSAWLTEEERKEAGVSDEANRRDIHERVRRNELNLGAII